MRDKKTAICFALFSLIRIFAAMNKVLIWTMLLCSLLLTGCDKLDDSDDGMIREILLGKWAFSYVFKGDTNPGLEFEYQQVIFNEDGTCAITYPDGALNGTYVASTTMLRIVSSDFDGEERVLLWRVVSLSAQQIVAEYDFSMDGTSSITAIVTLDKQ